MMVQALSRTAAAVAVAAALWWGGREPLRSWRLGVAGFEDQIVLACAAIGGAVAAWVAVVSVLTALATAPGGVGAAAGTAARWITPRALDGAARFVLGVSVVAAPIAVPVTVAGSAQASVALPDVGRPAQPHRPDQPHRVVEPTQPDPPPAIVVLPGDSLWAIATRHLGTDASPAAIAAEWPRWYAANRAAIGPDPNLIHPGLALRPPAPDDTSGGS